MAAKVICFANRKGGVAKTTTAHALLCGLRERGFKVLAVDVDGQKNLTSILNVSANVPTVFDVLTGKTEAQSAIQHTSQGDIIPAAAALELADVEKVSKIAANDYGRLQSALSPIRRDYDFIIIDTPPSAGILTLNALTAADALIIPVQADTESLDGVEQMSEIIDSVRTHNKKLCVMGILVTRFSPRSKVRRVIIDLLTKAANGMQTELFDTRIRDGVAVVESHAFHKSLFAIKSSVTADYSAFIEEFLLRAERC